MKYVYNKETKIIESIPDCADEWLQLIWQIGCDYDGYSDSKNLMDVIDEIVKYSQEARNCIYNKKLFTNEKKSIKYFKMAKKERDNNYDQRI